MSDDEYLDLWKKGSEKGFNFFYNKHAPPLVYFARQIVKSEDVAVEVVQQ